MNVSKQKNIRIGIISVLVIAVITLAIQIRSYITFYNEVQELILMEEQSVRGSIEGVIDFQKLHIEENNKYSQLPYANSAEELEGWISYNLTTADMIQNQMLSDAQTIETLIELSYANNVEIIINSVRQLYNDNNKLTLEDSSLNRTEEWVIQNYTDKSVQGLYTEKNRNSTLEVIFGAEDAIEIAKFREAILTIDTAYDEKSIDDLKAEVRNKRDSSEVSKVLDQLPVRIDHIRYIFETRNTQFLRPLRGIYEQKVKSIEEIENNITEKWLLENLSLYQADITGILSIYLKEILASKAIKGTNPSQTGKTQKILEYQNDLAEILSDILANDLAIRNLAQPDLDFYHQWTNRFPKTQTTDDIRDLLLLKDSLGQEFHQMELTFKPKKDSVELEAEDRIAKMDSLTEIIYKRIQSGKQIQDLLADGNGNTLALWLYNNDEKISGVSEIYDDVILDMEGNDPSNYIVWRDLAIDMFEASSSINEKLIKNNISDFTSIFRNASSIPFDFEFSVDTMGVYTTEPLAAVSHNGSLVLLHKDFYKYFRKAALGSIDIQVNDTNNLNSFVYEKYAPYLYDESTSEFMSFVDFLELNLHLTDIDAATFNNKKAETESLFEETYDYEFARYNAECVDSFKAKVNKAINDTTGVDTVAWRDFSIQWHLNEKRVTRQAAKAIEERDTTAKNVIYTLIFNKEDRFRKDLHDDIAMKIFKDVMVSSEIFALRLGKFNMIEIKIDREDYLGFLNEVNPPSYVVFKGPLNKAKEILIAQSPESFTAQGELKKDSKTGKWKIGEERKNWESDKDDDDE